MGKDLLKYKELFLEVLEQVTGKETLSPEPEKKPDADVFEEQRKKTEERNKKINNRKEEVNNIRGSDDMNFVIDRLKILSIGKPSATLGRATNENFKKLNGIDPKENIDDSKYVIVKVNCTYESLSKANTNDVMLDPDNKISTSFVETLGNKTSATGKKLKDAPDCLNKKILILPIKETDIPLLIK